MLISVRTAVFLFTAAWPWISQAAVVTGSVVDPSEAAIAGAQVSAVNRVGVVARATCDEGGAFELKLPDSAGMRLVITAAGFETKTIPLAESPVMVRLAIAAQTDSVSVAGSAIDVPASEQGGSVSIIPAEEIRVRNEPLAIDLLRYLPGVAFAQTGSRGAQTGAFIRGGDSNYNLVQIDGVPVNGFGGAFDFAHIPTESLERVEVIRGPQSAIYGPYANSGVINFVTRSAEASPNIEVLAEGGTYQERRFGAGASGTVAGFGVSAFASRMDSNGPVRNNDYRNESVSLGVSRNFTRQSLSLRGFFDSNEIGVPGPYGSNPAGLFPGMDLTSRNKSNFSDYLAHYQIDISPRVRQEVFGMFYLNNSFFKCDCGDWYDNNQRQQAESRTLISVSRHYTAAFGISAAHEEVRNTFIKDDNSNAFPIRRNEEGFYWENRVQFAGRFFLNAGLRGDLIQTSAVRANLLSSRPEFPRNTIERVNPKLALAYMAGHGARLHASFGTGIRPAEGLELAFTNNPALKPERTASFDAGIEQRLFQNRLALEGTYFYNRFYDLIVSLGGSLQSLSSYRSDNLANSRAQGVEFSATVRPARWVLLAGSYTWLKSEILSLDGSSGVAPAYFRTGQELLRRPAHSGAVVSTFTRGKVSANVTGYFRGSVLDVEPNWGAFAGLYRNHGFADLGINLNYGLGQGVVLYGNLRNALNRRYEEAYGFPSPLLNFVAGFKWTLSGAR